MCECNNLLGAIEAFLQKADDDLGDQLEDEGFIEPSQTVDEISDIEFAVASMLIDERDIMLQAAKKFESLEMFAAEAWNEFVKGDDLADNLYTYFRGKFEEMLPKFANGYISATDSAIEVSTLRLSTIDWVDQHANDLAQQMQLTSHNQIQKILSDGISEGKGISDFVKDIMDSKIRDEYYRARTVAVTEVLTAHSAAQSEAFTQSPVVTRRMWRHTGAYRNSPRENHMDMDGVSEDVGLPYTLKGADGETYYPMYPRDPILPPGERINCHCIEQAIVDEEILGLSLEDRLALQQKAIEEDDEAWLAEADNAARERAEAWRAEQGELNE